MIISTCEKFSDLWDAHIELLRQNWNDSNTKFLLVTDLPTEKKYENVTIISAGAGKEITDRLKEAMKYVDSEYILFTLDDYFLTERIELQAIDEDIEGGLTVKS